MISLDELVADARRAAENDDALSFLTASTQVQRELALLGEQLVDHAVQKARAAGHSWTDVGAVLGVTKQAAHQRHRNFGTNPFASFRR